MKLCFSKLHFFLKILNFVLFSYEITNLVQFCEIPFYFQMFKFNLFHLNIQYCNKCSYKSCLLLSTLWHGPACFKLTFYYHYNISVKALPINVTNGCKMESCAGTHSDVMLKATNKICIIWLAIMVGYGTATAVVTWCIWQYSVSSAAIMTIAS